VKPQHSRTGAETSLLAEALQSGVNSSSTAALTPNNRGDAGSLAVSFSSHAQACAPGVSALRSFFEKQGAAMRTAARYSIAAM
jgi:hypothetical protein